MKTILRVPESNKMKKSLSCFLNQLCKNKEKGTGNKLTFEKNVSRNCGLKICFSYRQNAEDCTCGIRCSGGKQELMKTNLDAEASFSSLSIQVSKDNILTQGCLWPDSTSVLEGGQLRHSILTFFPSCPLNPWKGIKIMV